MTRFHRLTATVVIALLASACSTKPRNFSAMVQPAGSAAPEQQSESETFATCDQLVRKGRKSGFAAAAGQGAAAAGGLFAGAAGVATSGTVGIGATAGGAVLTAAIPFVGLAAGFGVNRLIRSGKERKYKRVMTECMGELGYEVVDWARAPKRQPGTATLVQTAIPPTLAQSEATTDLAATSVP